MPSERETILAALFSQLSGSMTVAINRNDPLPTKVPATGLAIMRDGDPGEPEVSMSPLRYHYEHVVEVEAYFEAATGRDTGLDAVCAQIGAAIALDRTLGGLCDWIETGAPDTDDLALDGAESLKAAIVPLTLHYAVADPLT
ncbi:hypothetical protein EMVG_00011 [Emiliania huxleyi virus PS401]|nr:hypothetical protein EMVG_00011 [Emiliania huxleyi virus PS401]